MAARVYSRPHGICIAVKRRKLVRAGCYAQNPAPLARSNVVRGSPIYGTKHAVLYLRSVTIDNDQDRTRKGGVGLSCLYYFRAVVTPAIC